jgi:hypothetical protein
MSAKSRVDSPFLSVFGRLKPGFNLEQANAEMKVIRRRYAAANPESFNKQELRRWPPNLRKLVKEDGCKRIEFLIAGGSSRQDKPQAVTNHFFVINHQNPVVGNLDHFSCPLDPRANR